MCNLYNLTSSQAAIADLLKLWNDQTGNLPVMNEIYPDYPAPVIHNTVEGRVMSLMRWGMPSPAFALQGKKTDRGVTNVRNAASPHWRRWLGQANRCVVPFNAFSEYQSKVGPQWFALTAERPLAFFAGIWTEWTSVRTVKEGAVTANLFGFLTTEPNSIVAPVHPKAMPVILTSLEQIEYWLTASTPDALSLQRPLPDHQIIRVERPR